MICLLLSYVCVCVCVTLPVRAWDCVCMHFSVCTNFLQCQKKKNIGTVFFHMTLKQVYTRSKVMVLNKFLAIISEMFLGPLWQCVKIHRIQIEMDSSLTVYEYFESAICLNTVNIVHLCKHYVVLFTYGYGHTVKHTHWGQCQAVTHALHCLEPLSLFVAPVPITSLFMDLSTVDLLEEET